MTGFLCSYINDMQSRTFDVESLIFQNSHCRDCWLNESFYSRSDDIYQHLKQQRRPCIANLEECESEKMKGKASTYSLQACRSHQYPMKHTNMQTGQTIWFKNADCASCELASEGLNELTCLDSDFPKPK